MKPKIMEKKPAIQDVRLAIYWKSLKELDLYRNNQTVLTVSGNEIDAYIEWMKSNEIYMEVID